MAKKAETQEQTQDGAAAVEGTNVVTMQDGRQVDFGKKGRLKSETFDTESGVRVRFDVVNGSVFDIEIGLDHPLSRILLAYGIRQKVGDGIVKAENVEDAALDVERLIKQLQEGKWSVRGSGEGVSKGLSILIEAIGRLKGYVKDTEQYAAMRQTVLGYSDDTIKSLRSNPNVKAIVAQIEHERAAERAAKLAAAASTTAEGETAAGSDLLQGL